MWNHKNIVINLAKNGSFTATVNGSRVVKPSLAAMKKHIDGIATDTRFPFTAYEVEEGVKEVKVTGVVVEGRSHIRREFLVDGKEYWGTLYNHSPEALASLKLLSAMRKRHNKLDKQMEKEREAMYAEVEKFELDADNYK